MNIKKPISNVIAFNRGRGQDLKITDAGPGQDEINAIAHQIFQSHSMMTTTLKCGCNYLHCVRCHRHMTTSTSMCAVDATACVVETFGIECTGHHHV